MLVLKMCWRLLLVAAVTAAIIPPAHAQRPGDVIPGETPDLAEGVTAPPPGIAYCYPNVNVCVTTFQDFQRSAASERQAERVINMAIAKIKALNEELERLKKSCTATLKVVPDGTRKKS